MKKQFFDFFTRYRKELVILMMAFVFIGLFSMASPIYLFNDMSDLNTWLAQGDLILEGKVLYKDIYEHKGPLQLIPYVIASIFNNSLFAFYIIESLLFFVYGLYLYKIAKLYTKKPLIVSLISMFLTTSSLTFLNTGTTEEITLCIFPISLFIFLNAISENRYLTPKECLIIGLLQAVLFWSKYTLCYLTAGLCFFMIYWHLKGKESIIRQIMWFLAGFGFVSILVMIYFYANNALVDLFHVYFYNTVCVYGTKRFFPSYLFEPQYYYVELFYTFSGLTIASLIAVLLKVNSFKRIIRDDRLVLLASTSLLGILFAFIGSNPDYYSLPLFTYSIFPLIVIMNSNSKLFKAIIMCLMLYAVFTTQNTHLEKLSIPKEEYIQLKIYDYINSADGKKNILVRANNSGFFYYTDNVPFNKYFTLFYINLEDIDKEEKNIIMNKEADFIISDQERTYEGYHLVLGGTAPALNPEFYALKLNLKDSYYLYELND